MDHGKLVLAGSVDEITRADREFNLRLSRPLAENELTQLRALAGLRDIQAHSLAGTAPAKDSADYLVRLDLSGDHINQDKAIAALLRSVLDMGVTPRHLTEGRSLETQFLELTSNTNTPTPSSE